MGEDRQQVSCQRCGNSLRAEDEFCGVCGEPVARGGSALQARQRPASANATTSAGTAATSTWTVAVAVLSVVVLASVVALVYAAIFAPEAGLLRDSRPEPAITNSPDRPSLEPQEATPQEATVEEQPPEESSVEEPSAEERSEPVPRYNLVRTPDGGLTAEVPPSWGIETGENSEKEGTGTDTWSYHVGEYLTSSITTAPNLDAWYSTGASGAYFVASRSLAQYSDYDLTHSFVNAGKSETCAETGPYADYDRPSLSGKLQAWYGCGAGGATVYALAAYPEGRECVVALSARISDEADREAVQHLVDTVRVDCDLVTFRPFASASASASP